MNERRKRDIRNQARRSLENQARKVTNLINGERESEKGKGVQKRGCQETA